MIILYFGIILISGYFLSVVAEKLGFPKIVGYLVAGLLLNPEISDIIPERFLDISGIITNFCLAFITFEIGSSFSIEDLKKTGKKYFSLAFFEVFGAFLFLFIIFFLLSFYILPISVFGFTTALAFSLLLASLGAPTDPSATLAVIHEYKAKGAVTNAVLGAAAFDDIITLILFSFSISIAHSILGSQNATVIHTVFIIFYKIIGAIAAGVLFGLFFNKLTVWLKIFDSKSLLILFLAFLSLTFGLAKIIGFDELFSTLTLGFVIRNFNKAKKEIINITENGLEDLFFLLFFVFSAMRFSFKSESILILVLIAGFIIIRMLGKYLGMRLGTGILHMTDKVKKYAFAGLIPQGGIVLGLSLIISQEAEFKDFSNLLAGIIMGATIIHEFIGPFIARTVLKKSGELNTGIIKK
ncbi:MAG: cation:proton antiporter [Bacteroidales bacterium]|nr:cation:proton antiporter [Bacteroidales bacterium]